MENKKKCIITGINGQDGSYLAELLLDKGYEVHGTIRRSSSFNTRRIDHLRNNPDFHWHYADITDPVSVSNLIAEIKPEEFYNLAAQSHVKISFEIPYYTGQVDAIGTLNVLEAIRSHSPKTKLYQASTSELYGMVQEIPQNEKTPFYPRSPYAVAKMYAYWITVNYREAYNLFACNGILFNHESPVRGETFVTRKITRAAANIVLGQQNCLYLGNLSAQRDWGHAKDYVEAMWLILQQEQAEDFVIATGVTTTVRDFVKMSFAELGIEVEFSGKDEQEKGVIIDIDEDKCKSLGIDPTAMKFGQTVVKVDPKYFRPTEVDLLIGDPRKANTKLGW